MTYCVWPGDPQEAFAVHEDRHLLNLDRCLQCGTPLCLSCFKGCPRCGFLEGADRRAEQRASEHGEVSISSDD